MSLKISLYIGCIILLSLFLINGGIAQKAATSFSPTYRYLQKTRKNIKADYIRRAQVGDTLTLDTIIIRYKTKRKDTAIKIYKYKGTLPIFHSRLADIKGDKVNKDTMMHYIDSPLYVYDVAGKVYKVVRYRFSYKKKDIYLDDETMNLKTHYELISYYVYGTPLPEQHAKHIRKEIKDGEEFWFEEIIVADDKGAQYFAPDIHITTY